MLLPRLLAVQFFTARAFRTTSYYSTTQAHRYLPAFFRSAKSTTTTGLFVSSPTARPRDEMTQSTLSTKNAENPLLRSWSDQPYHLPPFQFIQPCHFEPALEIRSCHGGTH
jgi:hypothetical protein